MRVVVGPERDDGRRSKYPDTTPAIVKNMHDMVRTSPLHRIEGQVKRLAEPLLNSGYGEYLLEILRQERR